MLGVCTGRGRSPAGGVAVISTAAVIAIDAAFNYTC
jgi:hypothetical protein